MTFAPTLINRFLLLVIFMLWQINLQAQQKDSTAKHPFYKPTGGGIELNYMHYYLWRGAYFGATHVSQPNAWLDFGNFEFTVSGNFNLVNKTTNYDGYTKKSNWDEVDYELDYEKEIGKYTLKGMAMAYFYYYQPHVPSTAEAGFRAERKMENSDWKLFTENTFDVWNHKSGLWSEVGGKMESELKHRCTVEWENAFCYGSKVFNLTYYDVEMRTFDLYASQLEIKKQFNPFYIKLNAEFNLFLTKKFANQLPDVYPTFADKRYSYNYIFTVGKEF